MEITKLERTVREAARGGSLASTFTSSEGKDLAGLNVSPELDQAAKTLAAKRRVRRHVATTLLNTTTARWV
jgi:hypothetical protein